MSRIFQPTVEILNGRTVLFNVKDGCLAEVTVDFAGRRIGRIVRITHQNFMDGPSGFPGGLPIPRRRRSHPLLGRNSVLLKAARSCETSTLRPVESTGERASRAAVSTTRLAFENSRLECSREGTVYSRAVPTSTEWKRHGGIFSYLRRRAYSHVRASHMHRIAIIEMHRLPWETDNIRNWTIIT